MPLRRLMHLWASLRGLEQSLQWHAELQDVLINCRAKQSGLMWLALTMLVTIPAREKSNYIHIRIYSVFFFFPNA